jgi:hypothetical protein
MPSPLETGPLAGKSKVAPYDLDMSALAHQSLAATQPMPAGMGPQLMRGTLTILPPPSIGERRRGLVERAVARGSRGCLPPQLVATHAQSYPPAASR